MGTVVIQKGIKTKKYCRSMLVCPNWNITYVGITRQALAGSVTLKPRSNADYKTTFHRYT
jgi:hypothetical protein